MSRISSEGLVGLGKTCMIRAGRVGRLHDYAFSVTYLAGKCL